MANTMLNNTEVAAFCNQMAMILKSGISAVEGISIMQEDAASAGEKQVLLAIDAALRQSGSFAPALESAGVFPAYMLNMVKIGEQSGKLDEVMASLTAYYEREEAINTSIKNAVTYPLIMIAMMLAVVLVLIIKVLPIFHQVFRQLGLEITGFSKGILAFGGFLSQYAIVFIVLLFLLLAVIFYFTLTESGRKARMAMGAKKRGARSLYTKIATGRFAGGMALALSSGLNPDESLKMAAKLTDNPAMQDKIDQCQALLQQGSDFAEALTQSGIFTGLYGKMITLGVKTGSLDEVMEKIAQQYEEEIDGKISSVISILEPTLVAGLSIVVGIILLSVMLPLMSILSSI